MKQAQGSVDLSRRSRLGAALSVAVVLAGLATPSLASPSLAGTATAAASSDGWRPFHDAFSFVEEDFCGVPGLTVATDGTSDGLERYVKGPHGLPYYQELAYDVQLFTNQANGESVTVVEQRFLAHQRVTDNQDGTLTAIVGVRAQQQVYDEQGTLLGRIPGQVTVEVTIDHGGTPRYGWDDEIIAGRVLRDSSAEARCAAYLSGLS